LLEKHDLRLFPVTFFAWDVLPFPFRRHLTLHWLSRALLRGRGGLFLLHEAVVPLVGEKDPVPTRVGRDWILEVVEEFIGFARSRNYHFIDPRELVTRLAKREACHE
jgi:hypothetical protein